MVWNVVDGLEFSDLATFRALDMNTIVEATFRLAPNYWELEGDLAIGREEGFLQRLPVPSEDDGENYYLINGRGLEDPYRTTGVHWAKDLYLLTKDLTNAVLASKSVSSLCYLRVPVINYDYGFRRSGTGYTRVSTLDDASASYAEHVVNTNSDLVSISRGVGGLSDSLVLYSSRDLEYRIVAKLVSEESDATLSSLLPNVSNIIPDSSFLYTRQFISATSSFNLVDLSKFISVNPSGGNVVSGLGDTRSFHISLFLMLIPIW